MSCTLKMLIHNGNVLQTIQAEEEELKNKEEGRRKGILGDHRCPPCHEWVTTHLSATVSNFSFRF